MHEVLNRVLDDAVLKSEITLHAQIQFPPITVLDMETQIDRVIR